MYNFLRIFIWCEIEIKIKLEIGCDFGTVVSDNNPMKNIFIVNILRRRKKIIHVTQVCLILCVKRRKTVTKIKSPKNMI